MHWILLTKLRIWSGTGIKKGEAKSESKSLKSYSMVYICMVCSHVRKAILCATTSVCFELRRMALFLALKLKK